MRENSSAVRIGRDAWEQTHKILCWRAILRGEVHSNRISFQSNFMNRLHFQASSRDIRPHYFFFCCPFKCECTATLAFSLHVPLNTWAYHVLSTLINDACPTVWNVSMKFVLFLSRWKYKHAVEFKRRHRSHQCTSIRTDRVIAESKASAMDTRKSATGATASGGKHGEKKDENFLVKTAHSIRDKVHGFTDEVKEKTHSLTHGGESKKSKKKQRSEENDRLEDCSNIWKWSDGIRVGRRWKTQTNDDGFIE